MSVITLENRLTRMHTHVTLEVIAPRCHVPTALLLAIERPILRVRQLVPLEVRRLYRRRFTALLLAFERTRMCPLVRREVSTILHCVGKALNTLPTSHSPSPRV